jgi:L-alanine-DL-glutamate epimerase-like enolase superfamily enzyme
MTSLELPFKQAFAHATATRSCTESIMVKAEAANGMIGFGEGCPRKYVTGETIQTATEFFNSHREAWEQFRGLEDLKTWMSMNSKQVKENPAAWCTVELALLDRWGYEYGQSIEALLNLQELTGQFQYSAVLGTENVLTFEKQAQQFAALNFRDFKVKVTGNLENDRQKIEFLKHLPIKNLRIRLDANNLWYSVAEAVTYLKSLQYPFMAIEEPLQVADYEGCRQISEQLEIPIILDESFLRIEQFDHLQPDPKTWIINIRISKMGGILRSLGVAEKAKTIGIPIIIGAQVGETSILTRAALTLANQYRDILLAQEGAFGTYLLEHDLTETPLMFGKQGFSYLGQTPSVHFGRGWLGWYANKEIPSI